MVIRAFQIQEPSRKVGFQKGVSAKAHTFFGCGSLSATCTAGWVCFLFLGIRLDSAKPTFWQTRLRQDWEIRNELRYWLLTRLHTSKRQDPRRIQSARWVSRPDLFVVASSATWRKSHQKNRTRILRLYRTPRILSQRRGKSSTNRKNGVSKREESSS